MTEFEINKKVARKLGLGFNITHLAGERLVKINSFKTTFNPCNNVKQAWEIMLKYDISVSKYGSNFIAFDNIMSRYDQWDNNNLCCENSIEHEKPLVAAMLVFLEI